MEISDILIRILNKFEDSNYPCICNCALNTLTYDEYCFFVVFYNKEVRNRKVFYYRNGERVHEDDVTDEKAEYYLFRPYDNINRIKWLNSKIKKFSK